LRRQKIKNVHLQYEFFSYNSPIQGALFVFIQSLAMWILGFNRIITLHQIPDKSDIEERLNNKGLKSWFFFTAIKVYFWIIFLLYNKIVVHEGIFKERLVKKYNLKPDKIVIINHISYSYEKRENNKKLFPDDFEKYKNRLLFFGYLSWYKGLDNLIQDFLALPKEVQKDTFLTIVGGEHPKQKDDKDYQNWLLDLKNKTKEFKNIMWFGFAKDEDLQKIFTSHTALMLPYQNLFSSSGPFAWGLSYNLPPLVSGKMSYLKELGFISYEPRQLDKALKTFNSKKDHYLDLTKKIQKERGIEKIEKEMIGLYI
jgi:glycosyltransferase involved in cell wall biosynthesis